MHNVKMCRKMGKNKAQKVEKEQYTYNKEEF